MEFNKKTRLRFDITNGSLEISELDDNEFEIRVINTTFKGVGEAYIRVSLEEFKEIVKQISYVVIPITDYYDPYENSGG